MRFIRFLLFPISIIYGVIIYLRNKLYDNQFFKSTTFIIPIISVGNLEVGGSGKTPMVEYLINNFKSKYQIATLSRGYGRKTKGFRWVKPDDDAINTGDEPLQLAKKFDNINVAVCEDRVFGINKIKEKSDIILMDDAFQHRAVKPGLSILLFDYHQIKKNKFLLPTGNYRESFAGKKRANIIVVTKCDDNISSAERQTIIQIIEPNFSQELFFSSINYSPSLYHVFAKAVLPSNQLDETITILLLTGIAKPLPLLNHLEKFTSQIIHHAYADHHVFTQKNMLKLATDFAAIKSDKKIIVTTQKDAVRLNTKDLNLLLKDLPIYEWPITVNFLNNNKKEFDNLINNYAEQHIRNN